MLKKTKKFLTVQMMATLDRAKLAKISGQKALKVFERAAKLVPAYRHFLKEQDVDPGKIRTIEDFKKNVPMIDKNSTFKLYAPEIGDLCSGGQIKDIHSIVASSGHGGCFSYGLSTRKEILKSQQAIDFMLDTFFQVDDKKTLLINCLPMGVRVHSQAVTVADTSVRSDIVIGIIRTFSRYFEQIILVGENSFTKKTLEEGIEAGIDWKNITIHLILGEEILPENLRTYLAGLLGIEPGKEDQKALIGSSFGVAEFGLNLFYETAELIRLRRLLRQDAKFKKGLIGKDPDNLPGLFHYNPLRIFVEETPTRDGLSQLVLTNLDKDASLPLIRYNVKDEGLCLTFDHLKEVLESFGYGSYIPRLRLPLIAAWGRDKLRLTPELALRPEFIKEILYEDAGVAAKITGNFHLSRTPLGVKIEVQAKAPGASDPFLESKIKNALSSRIPAKCEIVVYPCAAFPYGMGVDYERKFQYI